MASRASSDVVVRFIGDTGNLDRGLDNLSGRFTAVTTSLKGIATAGATVGAIQFFKGAIDQASDLQEATSKVGVIFGKAADDIEKYADKASDSIGQSERSAKDAAATFATFGKAAGLTGGDLSGFATELVSLSSDLASFHNADPAEVIEALGAGLRGEAEPMQRFGVLLNDAQLRDSALRQGLIKTTKEALTPQQKVLAAYDVIMKQTTDAQGDFTRTADGLANSQRTLKARFEDSQAEMGQKFLPIAQEVTHVLADGVLPAVGKVGDVMSSTLVPVLETTYGAVKGTVGVFTSLPGPLQAGAIAMGVWALAGNRVTTAIGGMSSGARGLGDDVRTAMGAFDVGAARGTLMALEERVPAIGRMGQAFRDNASAGLALANTMPGVSGAITQVSSVAKGVGAASLSAMKTAASGLLGVMGGPWGLVMVGAGLIIGKVASDIAEAKAETAKWNEFGKQNAEIMKDMSDATSAATRAKIVQNAEDSGLIKKAQALGISTQDVVDALMGEEDARKRVAAATDRGRAAAEAADEANSSVVSGLLDLFGGTEGAVEGLDAFNNAMGTTNAQYDRQRQLQEQAAADARVEEAAKYGVAGATDYAAIKEENFRTMLAQTGHQYDDNKTGLQNLTGALDAYNTEVMTSMDTEEGWFASLDQLKAGIEDNGTSLDAQTEAGRANRDNLEELSNKTKQLYIDQLNAGIATDVATETYNRNMQQVYATAEALGFNKDEADKLIKMYGGIPPNIATQFSTPGYEQTAEKLANLSARQYFLAHPKPDGSAPTTADIRAYNKDKGAGYATGGEVQGPWRGRRADNVYAALTPGEVVQSNDAGDYYGRSFLLALNDRKIPREMLPQFAAGGMVAPFPVSTARTFVPSPDAVTAALYGAVPGAGRIGQMQAWARQQAGKRYLWGAVGPGMYDCSGLVGNLYAMAKGLPLYRRYFTTAGMGPGRFGMEPGKGRFTVYLGPGHTAANVGGLHVEAYGGNGTPLAVGRVGTPLSYYNQVMHLAGMADGGLVRLKNDADARRQSFLARGWPEPGRVGMFRNGGWLQPGQFAYNETGRPEPVLSSSQWDKFDRLIAALEKTVGQPSKVIDVGGIHVTNRPVDVMQQLRFAEMMAGL